MRSDSGEARWEFEVEDLLGKLRENQITHTKEAAEAREGYYRQLEDKVVRLLSSIREASESGSTDEKVNTYDINLSFPEDHSKDYGRIIDVLEMTTAKTVKLTLSEFDKYVRDNWEWTESFKMSSSVYNSQ